VLVVRINRRLIDEFERRFVADKAGAFNCVVGVRKRYAAALMRAKVPLPPPVKSSIETVPPPDRVTLSLNPQDPVVADIEGNDQVSAVEDGRAVDAERIARHKNGIAARDLQAGDRRVYFEDAKIPHRVNVADIRRRTIRNAVRAPVCAIVPIRRLVVICIFNCSSKRAERRPRRLDAEREARRQRKRQSKNEPRGSAKPSFHHEPPNPLGRRLIKPTFRRRWAR
jgi:hypothetical protein